jgi:hypothetical protein
MGTNAPLRVHWMRHAKVASHQGNLPLTSEGRRQVEDAGRQFSRKLVPGEVVSLLHAPTRRTRESALILYCSMVEMLDYVEQPEVYLSPPMEHWAIRYPDIYVAGVRIELVSTAEALAEQLPPSGLCPEELDNCLSYAAFVQPPTASGTGSAIRTRLEKMQTRWRGVC